MSPTEINSSSNAGTVYLINCKNIMVKDLLLKNNGEGIHLYNTRYSTLENNIMENNEFDIYLDNSYDNHLTGNILGTASKYGTYLSSSDRNVLSNNTVSSASSYGIYLYSSDSNNLTENSVSDGKYGICLYYSTGNYLAGNLMQNNSYNFRMYDSPMDNNIGTSNSVDGKPIYYLVNVISPTEINSSSNAGTVYLINCKNITVKDLLLKNNGAGVHLYNTENSTLENNTIENNDYGIYLYDSNGNYLQNNRASGNNDGIYLYDSDGNNLQNNNVSGNHYDGINLYDSDGNNLQNNRVSGNHYDGICLYDSDGNNLQNNNILENEDTGLYLSSCGNNTLRNNSMTGNTYNFGLYMYNLEEYKNDIDTSNLVDGKAIYYLVDRSDVHADYFEGAGTIYLINCSNITVRDQTLNNNEFGIFAYNVTASDFENNFVSGNYYGILVENSVDVTLKSNNMDSNIHGILVEDSEQNVLDHNAVSGGIKTFDFDTEKYYRIGISIEDSSYNNLSSNNVDSTFLGIEIYDSDYNNLTDNTADSNFVGILIEDSDTSNLKRNSVNSNQLGGIYVFEALNNSLNENIVTSNGQLGSFEDIPGSGIFLIGCVNSKITGNRVLNNDISGLYLMYSEESEIYDNYFNNPTNVELANEGFLMGSSRNTVSSGFPEGAENEETGIEALFEPGSMNQELEGKDPKTGFYRDGEPGSELSSEPDKEKHSLFSSGGNLVKLKTPYAQASIWNATRTEGENVMGGAYIGGNCWALPDGSGWSHTCNDTEGDGICDLPYNVTADGINVDYLPLVKPPEPIEPLDDDSSGISGGSSHSPRYVPGDSGASDVKKVSGAQQRVTAGKESHLQFNGAEADVLGVVFTAEKYSGIVVARVEVLDKSVSGSSGNAKGIVYQQMNLLVGNERFESSENIKKAYIDFRVPKTWVEENNIDVSTTTLNRFKDDKWNPLSTEQTGEDKEYFYFRAETPGFSLYSITGKKSTASGTPEESGKMELVPDRSASEEARTSTASAPIKEEQSPGFGTIAVAVCLLLSTGLIKRKI
ncbi:MAG: NosD domain-containing protein [Methanosarcina sp.]|nr:NosD domain-containing protein [Methanosarcina sp.]